MIAVAQTEYWKFIRDLNLTRIYLESTWILKGYNYVPFLEFGVYFLWQSYDFNMDTDFTVLYLLYF